MATTLTQENREYIPNAWEQVPCPFCHSESFRSHEKYGPNHRYTYVQCRKCDLVYANPRPRYDQEFIDTAYSIYDTESHHLHHHGALSVKEKHLVEKYKITIRQITQALGRTGTLLEVGCATGLFLQAAKEEGWEVIGIDISRSMTEAATKCFGIPTHCGQYHELDLSQYGKFDVIYSSHVIEHIPNPNDWGKKFLKDLKSNGLLCLNVPNQYSMDRRLKRGLKNIGIKKDQWALWRTPDHLFEPHLKPMRLFLKTHGFQIIEAFTYSSKEKSNPSPADWIFHQVLKTGSKLRIFARPII